VIKLGLVAVVIIAGAMSRSLVRARASALVPAGHGGVADEEVDLDEVHRRLRISVGLETVVAVAVLVVTSLLVAANPSQASANQDFNASKVVQGTVIQVDVPSTRSGPMTFHLYASDPSAGLTTQYTATAALSLPGRNIEGVTVPLQVTGHAHWTAEGVDVPIRGTWALEITITIGDFTSRTAVFQIPVT
jgi:copper transport protein